MRAREHIHLSALALTGNASACKEMQAHTIECKCVLYNGNAWKVNLFVTLAHG